MDDEKPTGGVVDESNEDEQSIVAKEGTVEQPSTADVQSMYDDLGIKAKAPSDKPSKRPKADDGGSKKASKQDDAGGKPEQKQKDDDGEKQSKATPTSDSDGGEGDAADSKGSKGSKGSGKDGEEDGEVSASGDDDAEGVSSSKSSDNEKTSGAGEDDAEEGDNGAGQDEHKSGSEAKEEEGKRPGKSNPQVEKRIQTLTADRDEAIRRADEAERALREATQKQTQAQISQEDPEYSIEDFATVRDNNTGEILELSRDEAELAWRRWKDGYDQRQEQRNAEHNRQVAAQEREAQQTREVMQRSADAYDALANLMDEYPELVSGDKYDDEFAKQAMPIIEDSIEYAPGTEPGNPGGHLPIIVGLRIDPGKILKALKGISTSKRSLPLNGVNDNTERPSGVSVPHSRSSDPTVNAANELYKELGIKKRI